MLRRILWGRREINLKVKTKIFKAVILPVLICVAISWVLTRMEESRLDVVEMGML